MSKLISIYFLSQLSDVVQYDKCVNVETYVLPLVINKKLSDKEWKLELCKSLNKLFQKISIPIQDVDIIINKINDISEIFYEEMEDYLVLLNTFNQRKQYRIDISTENGKFSFLVSIAKKLSLFDYLGYSLI